MIDETTGANHKRSEKNLTHDELKEINERVVKISPHTIRSDAAIRQDLILAKLKEKYPDEE